MTGTAKPYRARRGASRARRLALALLASTPLAITGCQPQQLLGAVSQLLPQISGMIGGGTSGPSSPLGVFSSLTGGQGNSNSPFLGSLGSSTSGIGSPNQSLTGGIPGFDSFGQGNSNSVSTTGSKAEVERLLNAAAQKYSIPPEILKAVAWQESRWDPKATSFDGGHGKGVMQIDDRFHEFAKTSQVFDAAANIDYGARFLKQKYDETGSWEAALKRYNGGSDYPPIVMAHARKQPWAQTA